MPQRDFVIIGAGPAGEAAANKARELGASVAIVDMGWFGGSCPHIGCLPSKALLHAAARHLADPGGYDWEQASRFRDWMVNRSPDAEEPDDGSHAAALAKVGAEVVRGRATISSPGVVEVRGPSGTHRLETRNIVLAVGSTSRVPDIPGLVDTLPWTNREATLARELPTSIVVLGGGPTACELAQVLARFDVPVTLVQSRDRLLPTDHARNADVALAALRRDGVDVRLGSRAERVLPRAGSGGAHRVELADGTSVEGHEILVAVGRDLPVDGIGLEQYGIDPQGGAGLPRDGSLRLADGLWAAGDIAGPELHTHQGHYQGELLVRMALGEPVAPDYRALPRATYTDPELAFVGLSLEQAIAAGHDAFEVVADLATSARGYTIEAELGHATIVVDRSDRTLLGAAIAAPDATAAIHECVLALKARITVDVLADTIHAFPSTSRILNGLFAEAYRRLSG
ncbi:MAG TPA: NAD(P)/FAD-dependent oxidoreductase [Candidatus Limnocylindrales bacterium]|nr:NAD(P)/FAD-dependent oxidoreductase [Candidatus Limnocylindrales bacterium]